MHQLPSPDAGTSRGSPVLFSSTEPKSSVGLGLVMKSLLDFFPSWSHFPNSFTQGCFLKHLVQTFLTACFWETHPKAGCQWLPMRCLTIHPQVGVSALPSPGQTATYTKLLLFHIAQWLCFLNSSHQLIDKRGTASSKNVGSQSTCRKIKVVKKEH